MKNKIVKLVAFCMATILMIFLPGVFNLGFEVYLDISMKTTGKLPTVNNYKKLEKLVESNRRHRNNYGHIVTYDDNISFSGDFIKSGSIETNSGSSRPSVMFSVENSDSLSGTSSMRDYFSISSLNSSVTKNSSTDYSSTNIQVEGVDEGDILKNDGKYIYTISGDKLVIIEAFPASELKKVSEIKIEDGYRGIDLYLSGNKLFLITDNNKSLSNIHTKVLVYDIINRNEPEVVKTFEFAGAYSSSRMIDEKIYVFSNMALSKRSGEYNLPKYRENDVSTFREINLEEVQYIPNDNYTSFSQIFVFDLDMPLNTPKIVTYLGEGARNIYMSQNNLYMAKTASRETTIYKFSLSREYPRFEAKATVPGNIINQFAMDEYDGNFRIATTKSNVNAVYILSESMHKLGSVTNIARGEQIKSVRFEGERGYVVTFRNTDPLFVLDLSNVRAPKILGELKIPGYSTYLHPYDEEHVIGFGYDGTNFGTNGKLKVTLFDITDVTEPKEKFTEVIDARTSELLTNHKSLLFSTERDLIAFSVGDYRSNKIGKVYTINLEDGFALRGEIKHASDVSRMLYMDDVLYGVSVSEVSAHDINSVNELNRIEI